ncbi:N-acetyl-anhydromuranmyl-L-alanine amidase [uncultured phage_MedDCM-OCT-S28-C10]|uniref:N-acetyl-anhydromuranmyl-L-alanine amidase n=1 Tax=uncultured phage_MedDCM-OCT-S28-C10 TaxID=2741077 RepID=A0A6S4P8E2_9CAUD|nr:N-acetyl-anhydromuranmyl-L-alanine amidase [uncultured phage_MedDCM-OCT-S28-C10]BAQ94069.1 N-acetyl-anhydromuranmyl-L-alanine amidase [uncultured phage_MedDCM-OCT-S28-C10]BAR25271.1 N-acetyl-anhydromuranmyl-L-alanine amidase [uncultured Mediterranean phage uvMED]BAR25318.1 N-acetyl-anhydromuranmyl-L-alanine amidase [uncultured Mediterranean phage uvMED]
MDLLTIFIFGVIDNGVLVLAFYLTYLNLEVVTNKYLKISVSAFLLGVISAGVSNTISDSLGFFLQFEFLYGLIVGLGCLAGMLIIPLMEFIQNNKKSCTDDS